MSVQSSAETSDRSLRPTDPKSDKNYSGSMTQEAPSDPENHSIDSASNEGETALRRDSSADNDPLAFDAGEGKDRSRSGATRSKSSKRKASVSASVEDAEGASESETPADRKSTIEFSNLKQRALEFVQKSGDEIVQRYGHAFDDVKEVSKKVGESMKGKPYQLAMGAAGVVGLGVVLAKRYSQNRSVKSSPSEANESMSS